MKPASPPRTPAVLLALIAALVVLGAAPAVSQAAPCTPPVVNQVACENTQAGRRPEQLGDRRRRRLVDPGLRDVDERQQGPDDLVQDQVGDLELPHRHPAPGLLRTATGARLIASNLAPTGTSTQPACQTLLHHRAHRLRQLGRVARRGPSRARRSRACTSPISCATTPAATARSCSSCATTRATRPSSCRPPTRPGRPTTPTAATASTSARSPARPASPNAYKAAYKVSYNRPVPHGRGRQRPLVAVHRRRVPDDPLPRAQRLRRQLHLERATSSATRRCCRTTSSSCRAATTSTGRPRSARPSRPRATPASTSPSSPATRCSGRRAGSRAPTAPTRQDRTLVSYKDTHFTARQDPVEWTGHVARPALHDRRRRTSRPRTR